MPRNSLQQMLVEGAPFETRHGKPCLGTAALLKRFQLAQGQSTHAGIEVKMQLGLRARLTGTQRRKLLGVLEEKLDLETRFVATIKRLRIQVGIGAEQDRSSLGAGIHPKHDSQSLPRIRSGVTPKMNVVEDLMVEHHVVVAPYPFKA